VGKVGGVIVMIGTSFDYKNFYNEVGQLNGWDFSKVKVTTEGEQWDFYDEVIRRCRGADLLLDIGTGGGEALLSIAEFAMLLIGIDSSSSMIQTANNNLEQSRTSNVRLFEMDANRLAFPDNFFNIVSCRHSPFDVHEVARVLVKDGVFLTQQVCEADKLNLKQAFGRGQQYGVAEGTLRRSYCEQLAEAGFTDIQMFDYNAMQYYESYEDLVFLLKFTPIIPYFGSEDSDFTILNKFIEDNLSVKGIETNLKRFMIIARKGN
jgi:ubiquinone/menaquinone biosynthesis C-methylase UbiE